MKLFKFIPAALLGTLALTSCDDFLDKGSKDSLEVAQYLTSEDNIKSFTYQLYGPYTWNTYETKFSWCANELTVGNVYHNYGDEGQFFFLTFDNTNANLLDGYQGLYGVISRCNMLINEMPSVASSNGVSQEVINRALGEAYMFRGLAYFLLTEYWGETYLVLNNSNDIATDKSFDIPKASRAVLYSQVEKDWAMALQLLPADRWGNNGERATKVSAYGMLSKLYLTMASAACPSTSTTDHPFDVAATGYDEATLYQMAVNYATAAINSGAYFDNSSLAYSTIDDRANCIEQIFWPQTYNKENLFSLCFEQGPYGAGSARQVQFARSKYLDGGDDYYGGEKGLTVSLFNSFDQQNDARLQCTSYFTLEPNDKVLTGRKPAYKLYDGSTYYYYYNPNKSFGTGNQPYGSEPDGPVLNHCRKFVYSVPLTNKFSAPLTMAFLRTADLYLIIAEAQKALQTGGAAVATKTEAGNEWINLVRQRAGLDALTDAVALYDTDPSYEVSVDYDGENFGSYTAYSDTYDLFEERRHEFALECQNWLDLKRIYYRNAEMATEFLERQDRGWTFGVAKGESKATQRSQYRRQKENNMIDNALTAETGIDVSKVQWFFPLPSSITLRGNTTVYTDVNAVKAGQYPY